MTTTRSRSRYAVPSADELVFSAPHRGALLVLVGSAGSAAAHALTEVVRTVSRRLVPVEPVAPGFVTMAGVSQLCAALVPVVRQEAPELLTEEPLASGLFTAAPYRARQVGLGYLAESVTFAVTRRISRESHQSALILDRMARTLLRAVRSCPTFEAGLTVFIPDLDRWDRPSLRCLYRLMLLTEPSDRLSVVAVAAAPGPAGNPDGDDPIDRIGPARQRFLARLAATGVARLLPLPSTAREAGADAPTSEVGDEVPDDFDALLMAIGEALVFQNYERVYHLGRHALNRAADAEQEAQSRRLIGIADAQLDEFASASRHLHRAATLTADAAFAAHLHYLQGLIATKRHYDLDGAEAHYARGLEVLGDESEQPERRVERAWLLNGQALVDTLRAKANSDPATRDKLIASAFDREVRAFALVRGVPGAAPAYLRHNLMANLTFLLEITQRFDEAVRFWSRAFETYLASDSREFRVAFDARLGLLTFKAGRREEGIRLLEKARAVCGEAGDRFGEEEVCLKLGYAYAAAGDAGRAYAAYGDGLRIAHDLREADIRLQALAGMLWCLAELGATDDFDVLRTSVLRALPTTVLAERLQAVDDPEWTGDGLVGALRRADIARPMPSPKLRAYIPEVDLEGKPDHDLNRYLVWGDHRSAHWHAPAGVAVAGA